MAEKNKGGRPLKFESAEALQKKIDEYFEWCKENNKPETIARLAYWLGVDRSTVYAYENKDEFSDTIKRARERILAGLEEALYTEGKTGQIFLAKNYGYADKQELEHSGGLHHSVEIERMTDDELRGSIEATVQAIADLQSRVGTPPST